MLKDTQSMGKVLHKVFSTVVKHISQELTPLGESGSEVSHFIPEPRNFADNFVTSANFLVPGMKWENYEPDSPKGVNSCEICFTTVLNTLCKKFPMLYVAFNDHFHSDCLCLILSRIFLTCFSFIKVMMRLNWVTNVF